MAALLSSYGVAVCHLTIHSQHHTFPFSHSSQNNINPFSFLNGSKQLLALPFVLNASLVQGILLRWLYQFSPQATFEVVNNLTERGREKKRERERESKGSCVVIRYAKHIHIDIRFCYLRKKKKNFIWLALAASVLNRLYCRDIEPQ